MLDRLKSNCICDIMKLLYISPTFSGTGGIGPHAFRVAKKLGENGFDVELMDVPHIPIKNLKNPSFSILGSLRHYHIPKPTMQFMLGIFLPPLS